MKQIDWKRCLPYVVAIVLFLCFALFYCSPLLDGKVLQAGDVTHWQGFSHEAREYKAQTGETTWWTNSQFGGMPTFQITGSTPANVLRAKLQHITQFGFTGDWEPVGLLMGYLIGFFLMLLCFGVNPWLSIAGSFALTLSTYFMLIIPAGHITKASGLAALAPMVGGMYAIFRRKYWLGVPLFTIYGIIGLNLHPQMTYYVAMLMGLMALGEVVVHIREKEWKELGVGVAVLLVCVGFIYGSKLSWMQMNTEYLAQTMRGGHSELNQGEETKQAGLDLDYVTAWSYGVDETMTLLIPNFMGGSSGYDVGDKSLLYKELVKARVPKSSAKQFCQNAPTYRGEKAFTSGPVYVGAIICFLFVLGLLIVPGTYKWVLLIATIFSILLAWGRNFMGFTELFYSYFPMYNKFRAVESILVVAEITIPLLALLGVQQLVARVGDTATEKRNNRLALPTAILIAGGITGGLCLFFALFGGSVCDFTSSYDTWKSQMGSDIYEMILDQRASMLKSDAWRSFSFIVIAAAVLWFFVKGKMKAWHLYVSLAVVILCDLVPVNRRFFGLDNFVSPKAQQAYFNMQPWEEEILRDKDLSYRVLNVNTNTFNDSRTSYRLKSVGGYSAAKLRRYQDLIDAHISRNNFSVLNMLNTRYFITRDGVRYNPGAYGNAWFVDSLVCVSTPDAESEALNMLDLRQAAVMDTTYQPNRLFCQTQNGQSLFGNGNGGEITLTDYAPNRLTYQATTDTERMAVFSELYYPSGWHLYVDGEEQPIARVNYTLRAAVIPAGNHKVMMEFVPDALETDRWCVAIIIVALVASLILLLSPIILSLLGRGKAAV